VDSRSSARVIHVDNFAVLPLVKLFLESNTPFLHHG
jgi:hypothetical protein